ncbi:MAG: FliA/WhiG family RNA polymerase sigma factor [Planctomycetes bacterium]|nr:FliA/WhiG family RNA polymerase sigma factor [Planctomycetota bacterium]
MARTRSKEVLDKLWRKYKKSPDEQTRNELMEEYLPLVKYIAERLLVKLPQNVELDDLQQAGIFGLMDAIDGFDIHRGVKFETYCTTRIRGAILDELRSLDWVPRLVRSKANQLDGAWKKLEIELGRMPTDAELADELGLSMKEYDDMVKEASAVTMVSLSEKWNEREENKSLRKIDMLEDRKGTNPVEDLQKKEIMELVVKGLSRKERLIVLLYYFEELTMREIGLTLDLSESRVCQLHSRIITRLQMQMDKIRADLLS